jgi:hypothetical protein
VLAEATTDAACGHEDPRALSLDALEEELAGLAAHLDAATCRWLEVLAEFDRRSGWEPAYTRSCAQWLSWRCGVSPAAARESVRVAERLGDLPVAVRAAFARGELSYGKVRELTRVAGEECLDEQELCELAGTLTVAQLGRVVRAYRRVTVAEAREAHETEMLSWFWEDDGSLVLRARLAPEDGALVVRALETARDAARERRHADADDGGAPPGGDGSMPDADESPEVASASEPAGTPAGGPPSAREAGCSNVDALVTMADLALANNERPGGERCQVVVHVDAGVLGADAPGRCELEPGPAVAAETARRLACDAAVVSLVEREGVPVTVGRKTRTTPPSLRRALQARDRGCRFPGCASTRFVDAHHVQHWARGGETSLDNLVLLCRRHHRLVHEGGWTVELGAAGRLRLRDRHGVAVPSVPRPPPGSLDRLLERNRRAGLRIDGATSRPGSGERLDLALATDGLLHVLAPPATAG